MISGIIDDAWSFKVQRMHIAPSLPSRQPAEESSRDMCMIASMMIVKEQKETHEDMVMGWCIASSKRSMTFMARTQLVGFQRRNDDDNTRMLAPGGGRHERRVKGGAGPGPGHSLTHSVGTAAFPWGRPDSLYKPPPSPVFHPFPSFLPPSTLIHRQAHPSKTSIQIIEN